MISVGFNNISFELSDFWITMTIVLTLSSRDASKARLRTGGCVFSGVVFKVQR